jgi:uncharacterized membrane protein YphA (DoxX/SURF4 family)
LLLRLGASIPLIYFGILGLSGTLVEPVSVTRDVVSVCGGLFLLAGWWTPVVASVVAIDELWIAFSQHPFRPVDVWVPVLLAVISGAVAMLGPGAWSVDAHRFGRRRFDIGDRPPGR